MSLRDTSDGSGEVTFRYRKSGTRQQRRMTVSGLEFIRRFLQPVLPRGLQKVRHYGFLSPNARQSIESVRWLIAAHYEQVFVLLAPVQDVGIFRPASRCDVCGGLLVLIDLLPPDWRHW